MTAEKSAMNMKFTFDLHSFDGVESMNVVVRSCERVHSCSIPKFNRPGIICSRE